MAVIGQIEARALAAPAGQCSTAALVRQVITIGRDEAQRRARLAVGVCPATGLSGRTRWSGRGFRWWGRRWPDGGGWGVREAALICSTITGFPARVAPELWDAAEAFLVEQARVLDPKTFKDTAREVALMADPDGTPDDRDAHEKMEFHLGRRRGDGLTRCWGLLDDLTAEALRTAFGAMCSPSAERNRDRPDTAWPAGPADADAGGVGSTDPGRWSGGTAGDVDESDDPAQDPAAGAGEDVAAGPLLPDPERTAQLPTDPADGSSDESDGSSAQPARDGSDDAAGAGRPDLGGWGGIPADPGPVSTVTGQAGVARIRRDVPGGADGRPPDPPPDSDLTATPVPAADVVPGCREPEPGGAGPAGPVWRAPRLPYAWAPFGSVPSDYPPPPLGDGSPVGADAADPGGTTRGPGTPEPEPPPDRRSAGTKRAQALSIIISKFLDAGAAPTQGGERPHLLITIDEQSLHDRTRPAQLGYGDRLPAGQLRMLACDAQIIPAVLGGPSEVLDVGRAMRTFTAACRKAILYRDRGCVFPGCAMPGKWAEFHHIQAWYDGGPSDLHNGCLLCRRHHTLIHQDQWQVRLGVDRLPEIIPPTSHDLEQRPLRNTLHRPPSFAWPQVG